MPTFTRCCAIPLIIAEESVLDQQNLQALLSSSLIEQEVQVAAHGQDFFILTNGRLVLLHHSAESKS
ncbi:hypothetical protein [Pseudomonas syringae]|uniref:hypothetical protein n=1 Tax=Pseudomonas syringae TaxID=317 RepID=UPI003F7566D0